MKTAKDIAKEARTYYRVPPLEYRPPHTPLDLLHEDTDLLIFNKPSGLLSVPGKHADVQDSLELRAREAFPDALLVHRLDMDTSGVFIMARNKEAQRNLGLQFERRRVKKTYRARVQEYVKNDSGLIDQPLRCDWDRRPLQMVCYEHGKASQTKWHILDRGLYNDCKTTLLSLEPITGRSHQLRVHLAEMGHAILGDCFYAPPWAFKAASRLLLHAQTLCFYHPSDGTPINTEAPSHCEALIFSS